MRRVGPALMLTACLGLGACATASAGSRRGVSPLPSDEAARYAAAIHDASNPTEEEIVEGLLAVRSSDTDLSWRTIDGVRHVLVVSWTRDRSYYPTSGPYNTKGYVLWVTLVPEVRRVCSTADFAPDGATRERLLEWLGLRPNDSHDHFVEFWVNPKDLFRPCPDPEIDDDRCQLEFPTDVKSDHQRWIKQRRGSSYETDQGRLGYPWTQLGYTYDWGSDIAPHKGASEFVVGKKADTVVEGIWPTEKYCGKGTD